VKEQRTVFMMPSICVIITMASFTFLLLTSWSPPANASGIIASGRFLDGNWEIVTTDENGENMVNLSNNPAHDSHPAWSHDGKHIAFASDRDGDYDIYIYDIYIMGADGSNQRRITRGPFSDSRPSFAPNGQSLIFTRMEPGDALNAKIFIIDIDGQNEDSLINGTEAEWSPDGKRIAFRKGQQGIFLADSDGGNKLGVTGAIDSDPSWSPDGRQIVFSSHRAKIGFSKIFRMDTDGDNIVQLTQLGDTGQHLAPTYSPDGQYIAFALSGGGPDGPTFRIMVMKADGSELKEISQGADPSWFDPAFAVDPAGKLADTWGRLKSR